MDGKVYKLIASSYMLCGKEIEIHEDTTTLYSEDFDKRVTLHQWSGTNEWLVMPALAITEALNLTTGDENHMLSQRPGPAPLACSFDSQDQAKEWCKIHNLTIVPAGEKRIEKRYEL